MYRLGLKLKVDAAPVRRRINELRRTMSLQDLANQSGLTRVTITKIQYGKQAGVLRGTAEKIFAVTPMNGKNMLIDATGSRRRVQALTAMGWTSDEISVRIGQQNGSTRTNLTDVLNNPRVTRGLADSIIAVYAEMSAQKPLMGFGNRRAKARAQRRKWAPPPAWGGANIDDPAARPDWEAVLCEFVVCGRSVRPGRSHCGQCGKWLEEHGTLDGYVPSRNGEALVENARFISRAEGLSLSEETEATLVAERLGVPMLTMKRALERRPQKDRNTDTQAELLAELSGAAK
ncbi:helix-turn-helix domain-containing protein [Streptosporangium lutulentum]